MVAADVKRRTLRRRRLRELPLLFWLIGWLLPCAADTGTQREYELKAGVLYHLIEYVEWPAGSLSNNPPALRVGLLGQIPFVEALELLDGKTVHGCKLVIQRLTDSAEAQHCHVVFIGASEEPRLAGIVTELKNRPILTVGEVEGFAERGGIVNLVAGQNHVNLEINLREAEQARLSISSQLLRLKKVKVFSR